MLGEMDSQVLHKIIREDWSNKLTFENRQNSMKQAMFTTGEEHFWQIEHTELKSETKNSRVGVRSLEAPGLPPGDEKIITYIYIKLLYKYIWRTGSGIFQHLEVKKGD